MNDTTVKVASTLVMTAEFADDDTRTISQDNPKTTITSEMFAAAQAAAANVLIGDKTGARFSRFKAPIRRDTTTTEIIFN